MQDVLLCVWAAVIVIGGLGKAILFFLPLGKEYVRQRGHGPYRDAHPGALHAVQAENLELKAKLAEAAKTGAAKDRLIEQLWYRAHGVKYPRLRAKRRNGVTHARVAGFASVAAASGLLLGMMSAAPTHTSRDHDTRSIRTMLVPMTSGGEAPLRPPSPPTPEPNRFCLQPAALHVVRFETYHVYWPSAARKPDEIDLTLWLMQSQNQQPVIIAALY